MSLKDGKKKFSSKLRRSASQLEGSGRSLQASSMMGRGSVTFNNMVDMLGSGEDGDGETEDCDERVPLLSSR